MRGFLFFGVIGAGIVYMIMSDNDKTNDILAYIYMFLQVLLSIKLFQLDYRDFKNSKFYDPKNKLKSFFKYQKHY